NPGLDRIRGGGLGRGEHLCILRSTPKGDVRGGVVAIRIIGTYTDWRWPPAPDGYASFEWELTPRTDPSPDGYFWSHQFWLVGGEAGYVGLQTEGSEPTGKIAIFSIWDAVTADGPVYM